MTALALAANIAAEEARQGAAIEYAEKKNLFYLSQPEAEVTAPHRQRCRLDVYYPTARPGFSTLVWLHGGGLWGGDREIAPYLTELFPLLKQQGIALVSIDYRIIPEARCPDYIEDAAAGVAWTFKNIEQFGGDPDKIILMGGSAGAYLTSMIGLDKRWLNKHGIDADRLLGLIPLSGHAITHQTVREEQGIPKEQPSIDQYAPLYHVRGDAPPILLITGDRELEMLGRYEENAYFMRMLKIAGHKDVTLQEYKGYNHGNIHLAATAPIMEWVKVLLARGQASAKECP
ncbi:MAG: alpha/beta hydrolase [Thermoguttaceae bacterium]